MNFLIPRVACCCGAVLVGLSCVGGVVRSEVAPKRYIYRGVVAPQVMPDPLAEQLEQKLILLRSQLRDRSVKANLNVAIEQSLLHNPELAQAYSQIQQGEWNLIAVRRQWYPTLSASSIGPSAGLLGYGGSSTHETGTTSGIDFNTQKYQNQNQVAAQLSLGWTFFDPSRSPQIDAASESLRSQKLLFNVSARNLVLQTQLAYFNLQTQQQLIADYEEILKATSNQVNLVEALFNIGNATIADVEQIRTQQYQTLSLLTRTYLGLIDAAASLTSAMALPPGQLVLPADRLEVYGSWSLSLAASIQQAQALREEIQASMAQSSSARWRASALFNSYWPRFGLAANGSYVDSNSESRMIGANSDPAQSSSWAWSVGVGFNWSIFDGGIAAAQAQASKALSRQYSDQAAVQRLQVTQEVEQSFGGYDTSRLALLSSRAQSDSARKAAMAARQRFDVGYSDITTVVQTLNQAITAASAYSLSQKDYNSAVSNLYRATAQWPSNTLALRDQRVDQLKRR